MKEYSQYFQTCIPEPRKENVKIFKVFSDGDSRFQTGTNIKSAKPSQTEIPDREKHKIFKVFSDRKTRKKFKVFSDRYSIQEPVKYSKSSETGVSDRENIKSSKPFQTGIADREKHKIFKVFSHHTCTVPYLA